MDAETMPELLDRLSDRSFLPRPPNHKAVLRSDVENTGSDLDAVEAWLTSVGGEIRWSTPTRTVGLTPGHPAVYETSSEAYYCVPRAALNAPEGK
jgi:hypothetical protein